jgi:hypothetical protein
LPRYTLANEPCPISCSSTMSSGRISTTCDSFCMAMCDVLLMVERSSAAAEEAGEVSLSTRNVAWGRGMCVHGSASFVEAYLEFYDRSTVVSFAPRAPARCSRFCSIWRLSLLGSIFSLSSLLGLRYSFGGGEEIRPKLGLRLLSFRELLAVSSLCPSSRSLSRIKIAWLELVVRARVG